MLSDFLFTLHDTQILENLFAREFMMLISNYEFEEEEESYLDVINLTIDELEHVELISEL